MRAQVFPADEAQAPPWGERACLVFVSESCDTAFVRVPEVVLAPRGTWASGSEPPQKVAR
jgi:hypothetical protein